MKHAQIGDIVEVSFKMVVRKVDGEWNSGIRLYGKTLPEQFDTTAIPAQYCRVIAEDNEVRL